MTVAPADERVTLTAEQLDMVTAGYGYVLMGRMPGTSGWEQIYAEPPDTFTTRSSAEYAAEKQANLLYQRGRYTAFKIQITGH